jgi:transcriptional regulator of acetoin/glycerol metabolism
LPALRERTDFEAVVRRILASLCEGGHQVALSAEVMNLFRRYHWPGNVRQLHNLLRTAVILAGESATIEMTHLPDDFLEEVRQVPAAPPVPADTATVGALRAGGEAFTATARESLSLRHVTISAMAHMLRVHKGNVSAAAKALGVSRNTIYRKKDLLPPDVLGG